MKLKDILKEILEQDDLKDIVEFPNSNINLFIDRNEKKITLSPVEVEKPSPKSRVIIRSIEGKFAVKEIKEQSKDLFEITFSPSEDFESVVDFVKNELNA